MNETVVVGGAPVSGADAFYAALLAGAFRVVAADSAGEWCVEHGRVPDVVVGDFDSAAPGAAGRLSELGARVVEYSRHKDETDLELAVDAAFGLGPGPLVLTAAFTRRIDHTLAALGSLTRAGAGARAIEPGWASWVCVPGTDVEIEAGAGATVSLLAIGEASGVSVSGAAWTLDDARLDALSGRGVSNRATGGPIRVHVATGTLIVVLLDDEDGGLY